MSDRRRFRLIMDAKTLESWRLIETYRRLGKKPNARAQMMRRMATRAWVETGTPPPGDRITKGEPH